MINLLFYILLWIFSSCKGEKYKISDLEYYEESMKSHNKLLLKVDSLKINYFYTDIKWMSYLKYCEYKIFTPKFYIIGLDTVRNPMAKYNNCYMGELESYIYGCSKHYSEDIKSNSFSLRDSILKDTLIEIGLIFFLNPKGIHSIKLVRYNPNLIHNKRDTFNFFGTYQSYVLSDSSKSKGIEVGIAYNTKGFTYPWEIENICNKPLDSIDQPISYYTQCGKKEFIESHRYILNDWFVKEAERRNYISADNTPAWKQWVYRKYYQATRRGIKWFSAE